MAGKHLYVVQESQKLQLSSDTPAGVSQPTGPESPWLHCDVPSVGIHRLCGASAKRWSVIIPITNPHSSEENTSETLYIYHMSQCYAAQLESLSTKNSLVELCCDSNNSKQFLCTLKLMPLIFIHFRSKWLIFVFPNYVDIECMKFY